MFSSEILWPADEVKRQKVGELVPYARNARTHSPEQVAQLAASITEWGWTVPVLVDEEGGIIAGHGRVLAAEQLGLVDVPTMTARGWSDAKKRAYILADNKLALNSGWDLELLSADLIELGAEDVNLALSGFSLAEIQNLSGVAADPAHAWGGMPEYQQKDKTAFRSMTVHFKDQAAVEAFAALIAQKVTDKTRFVWYPSIEIETYADKRYAAS